MHTRQNTLTTASTPAGSHPRSGCSFFRLSLELRRKIYRLVFPTKATGLPSIAKKPSYLNLLYTSFDVYTDASSSFYSEATFLINISIPQAYFLGKFFQSDERPHLPDKKLYGRIQKLCIEIDWEYNPYVGRMGCSGNIEKAADKMEKNIENVCSALAPFVRLGSIEILCYSKRTRPTGGGPDTSIPRPLLTKDLLRPFELLQQKKSKTEIWITDIENLTGRRPRRGESDRKPLKTTVVDLAYQLRGRSGLGHHASGST